MELPPSANVRCRWLGEYVDEADDSPPRAQDHGAAPVSEVVKARVVSCFVDHEPDDPPPREVTRAFAVLLKNPERTVVVRGSGLRYIPSANNPSEPGSYAVLAHDGGRERIVALVPTSEVIGIFAGDITAGRAPPSGSAG